MNKNDTRIRTADWNLAKTVHSCVLICFGTNLALTPIVALADTAYTPPPAVQQGTGFPSDTALSNMGYNKDSGVLKVNTTRNGSSTVTSSGGKTTGSQGVTVTVTDKYGNKASTTTTVKQTVGNSALSAAIGAAWAGTGVATAINTESGNFMNAMQQGNYAEAAAAVVRGVGKGVDAMFGGVGNAMGTAYSNASAQKVADSAMNVMNDALNLGLGKALLHKETKRHDVPNPLWG